MPLVGHAVQVWRDPLGFLGTLRERGDLVRLDLGTLPVYVVTSSELVYEATTKQLRGGRVSSATYLTAIAAFGRARGKPAPPVETGLSSITRRGPAQLRL